MTAGELTLVSNNSSINVDIINIGYDQDIPKFSFFDTVYRRHTNFGMENKSLTLSGSNEFGREIELTFDLVGDLVGDIHLEITLPSATSCFSSIPPTYANWTNSVGFALIEYARFYVGNSLVDEQDGTYFDIQNELTDPTRKLWPLVGKVDDTTKLKFFQTEPTKYIIPLMFSFCKYKGLALPIFLTGTDKTQFRIQIGLRNLESLLLHDGTSNSIINSNSTITSINAYATYYSLETYEKERIKRYRNITRSGKRKIDNRGDLVHLIETVEKFNPSSTSNIEIKGLTGSIKEIYWVLQPDDRISSSSPLINDNLSISTITGNDFFNYSSTSVTNNSRDPFGDLQISIGKQQYERRGPGHFRQYLPYKHHSNVPNSFVYCFPFSLNPEEYQPSGTFNMANTNTSIEFDFNNIPSGFKIKFFIKSYKFLLMNLRKASVQPVKAKTQSDILQDSLIKTGYEGLDVDVVVDSIQQQQQQQKITSANKSATAAQSANFDLVIANFNQTVLAQNNRILQLQEFITQSQQTIKILNNSIKLMSEDIRRLSQARGGSGRKTGTAKNLLTGRDDKPNYTQRM